VHPDSGVLHRFQGGICREADGVAHLKVQGFNRKNHDMVPNIFAIPLVPRARDFNPRDIDAQELPAIMRRHIYTGAMGGAYGWLTTNLFFVALGNALGMTVFQWGVLNAFCTFALAFQLFSAHWAARLGHRRLLWWAAEGTSRLMKLTGLAMALYFYRQGNLSAASYSLLLWLCLSGVFAALAQPVWFSWLTDIIPERIHGSFMGRREVWVSLLVVALAVPAGYAADAFTGDVETAMLTIIFLFGVLLGMMDISMHRVIPEPPMAPDLGVTFKQRVLVPLRDRQFRPWLVFAGAWSFSQALSGPLAMVYFVDDLRLSDNFLGGAVVLIAVPLLAVVLTSRRLGILVDRIGVRRMLLVTYLSCAILPIFWIVATPETALFWLTVSAAVGGAAGAPAVNAGNKLITRTPPRHQRAMYMAMSTCVGSLAGGLGPLVAGVFLVALGDVRWTVAGMSVGAFHLLFLVSLVLRVGAWGLLFRVQPPEFDLVARRVVVDGAAAPCYGEAGEVVPEKAA